MVQELQVDQETAKIIAIDVVNRLGEIGDGRAFDPEQFQQIYRYYDYWGTQRINKQTMLSMVNDYFTKTLADRLHQQ